jgi:hypothetical protein
VHDGAGREDPLGDRRGLGRDLVDRERAVAHAPSLDRHLFLEHDRQALQRTNILTSCVSFRGVVRGEEGRVVPLLGEGVDGRLDHLGTGLDRREQLDG